MEDRDQDPEGQRAVRNLQRLLNFAAPMISERDEANIQGDILMLKEMFGKEEVLH